MARAVKWQAGDVVDYGKQWGLVTEITVVDGEDVLRVKLALPGTKKYDVRTSLLDDTALPKEVTPTLSGNVVVNYAHKFTKVANSKIKR